MYLQFCRDITLCISFDRIFSYLISSPLQEIRQEETAQQFQESVNTSLDETKNNVRKSIDEARNQIPQYTNVVKNYQEKALDSTGKIVEDYIEAQKSVINSVFSSANVYCENV
jgi:hypothetical protein